MAGFRQKAQFIGIPNNFQNIILDISTLLLAKRSTIEVHAATKFEQAWLFLHQNRREPSVKQSSGLLSATIRLRLPTIQLTDAYIATDSAGVFQ
ncbi:MAG: hypothetical protein WD425_06045 [Nitrospirales bacterium]